MKKKGLLVGVSALALAGLSTALTSCAKTATYTVKFYDGTTEYDSKTVPSGYNVEVPEAPTSDGKIFNGWYSDESLTTPFDFGSIVEKDTQVYAAWVNKYSVTFKDGDSVIGTDKVTAGYNVKLPETPTKEDRAFNGWYLDSKFKQPYDFGSIVTGDVTLYASFVSATDPKTEFRATYMVDGEVVSSALTFKQKVEELPEIEVPAGKEFAGWWVSDYQDSTKLTYQFDITKPLTQDVILFAVFKDANKPLVSVEGNKITWDNKGVSKEYSVNITDADNPEADVIATRRVSTTYLDFDFDAQPAGNYLVEVTCGDYTGKAYYSNKALDRVNIFIDDFEVSWNKVSGATNYKLTIDNGMKGKAITVDLGDENTYSFDKVQMQANGIKFKVEAQAEDMLSSVKEYTLTRVLDKVSNLKVDSANDKLSWDDAGAEKYKVQISANGKTNTYYVSDNQFDLDNFTGEITYSVSQYVDGYYAYVENGTYTKALLSAPKNLTLAADGYTVVWDAVPGATQYAVRVGNELKFATTNEYVLTEEEKANLTSFTVQALAEDAANNSEQVELEFATAQVTWVEFYQGILSWSPVLGATKYALVIDDNEAILVEGTSYQLDVEAGHHTYKVAVANADGTYDETKVQTHENTVYNLIFDTNGGEEIAKVAYEVGSEIDLPTAYNPGYSFTGWYKTEGNYVTDEFTDSVFTATEDITIHAGWLGNNYKATLEYEYYAVEEFDHEAEMTFGSAYSLPVPVSSNPLKAFGGWYARPDGQGEQYTDEFGNSLLGWRDYQDVTLYAGWLDVFTFNDIDNGTAYSVAKGRGINLLSSVTIPALYNGKPVTTVEVSAFESCSYLIEVNIPNSITLVETGKEGPNGTGSCFKGCSKLERVNVYEVEGVVPEEVVYESIDGVLIYHNNATGVELAFVPYYTKSGEYTIPSVVTYIPRNAFNGCSKIEKVYVPASVNYIGENAFKGVSKLTEVIFEAPAEGAEVSELILGKKAFDSSSLLKLVLPARISSFNKEMVDTCSKLESIDIVGEYANAKYASIDGVVFNGAKTELLVYPRGKAGEYVIPTGVTRIAENAFASCSNLTGVTISGQVTEIAKEAFKSCSKMETLVFEGDANDFGLTIRELAFSSCSSLTEVVLPANLVKMEKNAFASTSKLTNVTVLSVSADIDFATNAFGTTAATPVFYVTDLTIGKDTHTFEVAGVFGTKLLNVNVDAENPYYTSIDGVLYDKDVTVVIYYPTAKEGSYTLPNTVVTIGARVFQSKTGITDITFPNTLTYIGEGAFQSCSALETITFVDGGTEDLVIDKQAFQSCTKLTTVILPERLTTIGEGAFRSCGKVVTLTLPSTLKTIGDYAFTNCSSLEEVVLPKNLEKLEESLETSTIVGSSDTMSRSHAFQSCTNLTSIRIDESNSNYKTKDGILYKVIKDNDTYKGLQLVICPQAKTGTITLPADIVEVADKSFYYSELTQINFQDNPINTVVFGSNVFYYSKMTSVRLPGGLKELPINCFYYCKSLTSITYPNTVEVIDGKSLYECTNIESIEFEEGGTAPLEFVGKPANATSYYGLIYNNLKIKTLVLPERTTKIGDYAFSAYISSGSTSNTFCVLEKVVIPSTVKMIGKYAFNRCPIKEVEFKDCDDLVIDDYAFYYTNIETLTLPSVKTIGKDAFAYCQKLTTVTLPSDLEKISTYAFYNDTKLASITIPASVTVIDDYAFYQCSSLATVTFEENSALETIGNSAFDTCKSLKSITIPKSVKTIGYSAFEDSTSLETIIFEGSDTEEGAGIREIKYYAFGNTGLKSFEFPYCGIDAEASVSAGETVYNVLTLTPAGGSDLNIFQNCKYLKSIYLSENITFIEKLFNKCSSLETITIAEGNRHFTVAENSPVILTKDGREILYTFGKITSINIPESATKIGSYAFAGQTDITSIVIPKTVKEIGQYAFQYCMNLKTVTFETGSVLDTLGTKDKNGKYTKGGVFNHCINLETIVLPNYLDTIPVDTFAGCLSLKNVTLPTGLKTIGQQAFAQTRSLETITFPDGLETIYEYAFSYSGLKEITIPASLKDFIYSSSSSTTVPYTSASGAFQYCYNLEKVTFEEGSKLNRIGQYLFRDCFALKEVNFASNMKSTGNYMFQNCTSLESIVLPKDMTIMGSNLFNGCTSLKSVVFPDALTFLSPNAFANCTALEEITIPASVKNFGASNTSTNVTATTTSSTFLNCTALEKVTFEEGTVFEKLGANAFEGCTALKTIDLPDTLTIIGNKAFLNSGLESITIPANVTTLGSANATGYTFQNCKSLKTVVFNEKLTTIYGYVFDGCEALEEVTVPATVTKMGNYVFSNCTNLKTVDFQPVLTIASANAGSYMFQNCTSLTTVTLNSKATALPTYMFDGCSSLEGVTLPTGLTYLPQYIFRNCTSLKEITIPKTVKNFGGSTPTGSVSATTATYCFYGCESLEKVTLESGSVLTTIGTYAFYNCKSLESFDLSNITALGTYAFYGCASLTTIVAPKVTSIGNYTFYGCKNLTSASLAKATSLGTYAFFNCSNLVTVDVPLATTYNTYAFRGCSKLESITPNAKLTTIGQGAFEYTALKSFNIPSTVTTINGGAFNTLNGISITSDSTKYMVYEDMAIIETTTGSICTVFNIPAGAEIVVPNAATAIKSAALMDTKNLRKIVLPDTIKEIPSNAFYSCTNLEEVVLGNAVTTIASSAFQYCSSLSTINFPDTLEKIQASAFDGTALVEVVLPEGLTVVANAFKGIKTLETLVISSTVNNFSSGAFADCTSLKNVTLADGLVTLYSNMFENCTSLESITLPGSLATKITSTTSYTNVFKNCTALKNVVIEEGNRFIPNYTFYGCSSLETIEFPSTLEGIGTYAFVGTAIKEIEFNEGLTKIDGYAFQETALKEVTFPDSVNNIGTYAFANCAELTTVTFGKNKYTIGKYAFTDCPVLANITLPEGFIFGSGSTASYAFANDLAIKSFVFPTTAMYVPEYILSGCTNLEDVTISEGIDQIYYGAFENCTALTEVVLPESLTVLRYMAFANCTGIKQIVIPVGCDVNAVSKKGPFTGWTKEQKVISSLSLYEITGFWDQTISYSSYYTYWSLTEATFVLAGEVVEFPYTNQN